VSSGVQVPAAATQGFEKGRTTMAEVQAKLGAPTVRTSNGAGGTIFVYSGVTATTRAATFLPIVGAFAGGADTRMTSVTLTFDPHGVLTDVQRTEMQSGSHLGASQPQVSQKLPSQRP
jgi:hypothetical protein